MTQQQTLDATKEQQEELERLRQRATANPTDGNLAAFQKLENEIRGPKKTIKEQLADLRQELSRLTDARAGATDEQRHKVTQQEHYVHREIQRLEVKLATEPYLR